MTTATATHTPDSVEAWLVLPFLAMASDQNLSTPEELEEFAAGDWVENFYGYHDTMEDFAAYILEETGALESLPEFAQGYFDFAAYGRDLEYSGEFSLLTDSTGNTFVIHNY
jgi:antirestriction protein